MRTKRAVDCCLSLFTFPSHVDFTCIDLILVYGFKEEEERKEEEEEEEEEEDWNGVGQFELAEDQSKKTYIRLLPY